MTRETKFRGGIAMTLLGLIIMTFFYFQQQDELRKCQAGDNFIQGGDIEKANLIDSLNNELFNEKVHNGRYELTFDHLMEVNPKLGKEMEEYMSHETE